MPNLSPKDMIIPSQLFGSYSEVKKPRMATYHQSRALQDGTWKYVLEDTEYVSLAERDEDIICNHPALPRDVGENWQLCVVQELIFLRQRPRRSRRVCQIAMACGTLGIF